SARRPREPAVSRIARRSFLGACAATAAFPLVKGFVPMKQKPHVVVVGAGAFGGWTALYLQRQGARVTLVDAWGPGNARARPGAETAKRNPQINSERARWAIFERDGGYLTARRACAAVLEGFLAAGGVYRQVAVQPPVPGEAVRATDGSTLAADVYVFACGPWLGKLFPDVIGDRVRATRQEVFFFGTPPGDG